MQQITPEDQEEPRERGWGIWVLIAIARLGAIAGVIGILAALFVLLH